MKQVALLVALGSATLLGGCLTAQQITDEAVTAQGYAKQICGYLAPIGEIASLVAAFVPNAGSVVDIGVQIGNEICSVATKAGAHRGASGGIVVQGVEIHGHFVAGAHRRH